MEKVNYSNSLFYLKNFLKELVADRIDVNRHHVEIMSIGNIVAEVFYEDEDDNIDAYYRITYRTRYFNEEKKNFDYGEETVMYWCHTESTVNGDFSDVVVTEDEFDNIME